MANNGNANSPVSNYRWRLALILTCISIAGIASVAWVAIGYATDKAATTQMVFTATVPLLASWVGAVIAYYFSSESMDAATRSVKELMPLEEKLKAIPVTQVMIKLADIAKFKYDDSQKVQDVLNALKASGKGERLPFLDKENKPIYILHKSAVDGALVEASQAIDPIPMPDVTFQQLFEKVPALKVLAMASFGTLGQETTLEAVRAEMMRIDNCQDVFITENGTKDSPVLGWVTNGIIEENSKL
jgi:hypothetical protein